MKTLIQYFNTLLFPLIPETRCFGFKRFMLRKAGVQVGKNVRICSSVKILGTGKLKIGDNTWIGPHSIIFASKSVSIGSNCDIAPRVFIGDGTHIITPERERIADIETCESIEIGNGCWICVNSTILPGTTIGNKSVIAAAAVVKGKVPSLEMWGGCIARRIKQL